jgi:crotonobetainyl-CoA:carnitine CoA-transferase CaiB-like acyl-CoA transferase
MMLAVGRPASGNTARTDLDALYFTQLNSNKRSLEVNTRTPEGKEIVEKLSTLSWISLLAWQNSSSRKIRRIRKGVCS